jgi:hypothetical protein
MLRFMDWSVVAMGCLLVLAGLTGRGSERARAPRDKDLRFHRAWLPLLMGPVMLAAKVPGMLHAPHSVVETVDALAFVLAATAVVLVLYTARRSFGARGSG